MSRVMTPIRTYTPASRVLPAPKSTRPRVLSGALRLSDSSRGSSGHLRTSPWRNWRTYWRSILVGSWGCYSLMRKQDTKSSRISIHRWPWESNSTEQWSDEGQVVQGHMGQVLHLWALVFQTQIRRLLCFKVTGSVAWIELRGSVFFFFLISPKCALSGVDYFELKMIKTQQTQEKLLASPLTAQNNVDYTAYARKRAITGENFNFRKIYPPGGANIYSSGTCSSHPPLGCLPPPWSPTPFSLAQGSV